MESSTYGSRMSKSRTAIAPLSGPGTGTGTGTGLARHEEDVMRRIDVESEIVGYLRRKLSRRPIDFAEVGAGLVAHLERLGVVLVAPKPRNVDPYCVRSVFEYWKTKTGRRVKLTDGRRKKVVARLREGYSASELKEAVDGLFLSEFHQTNGFLDLVHACKSAENVDRFRQIVKADNDPTPNGTTRDRLRRSTS